jgi:hypothetical protein
MYSNNKSRYKTQKVDDRTLVRPFANRSTPKNNQVTSSEMTYVNFPGDEVIEAVNDEWDSGKMYKTKGEHSSIAMKAQSKVSNGFH